MPARIFKRVGQPNKKHINGDFPGRPVVKTQHIHCKGCGFNPWSRNQDSACCIVWQKKKNSVDVNEKKMADGNSIRRELSFSC